MAIFSKRNRPPAATLKEVIHHEVRMRVYHTIQQMNYQPSWLFTQVGQRCLKEYGSIDGRPAREPHQESLNHFQDTSNERAIDFIEMIFESEAYTAGQNGVAEVNKIFREEGVAYEFTPFSYADAPFWTGNNHVPVLAYPLAMKRSNDTIQSEVVRPAMELLAGAKWKSANEHMRNAHGQFRVGEFRAAITECGSALESTLKIICQEKGWRYEPQKATLSDLVKVVHDGGLIEPFYVEILKNAGTIRNKLAAHGSEPTPAYTATAEHAEHMINLTSTHILFLVKSAGVI